MKILHLCLSCFYIDNHSYQENLLPKYHKKLGYDVEIIASQESFDENGNKIFLNGFTQYKNENGIKVTRLDYLKQPLSKIFKRYENTYKYIKQAKPDIIFVHGSQFLDLKMVSKYCKANPKVKLYIDNHADFSNSAKSILSREILHKIVWKRNVGKIISRTEKFYGVLPARVKFLKDIYKIPSDKIELLVMGADSDYINHLSSDRKKEIDQLNFELRETDKNFLVVTGGKIDNAKKEIFELIEAVKRIENTKLVIFGSVIEELQERFNKAIDHPNIKYVGWIKSQDAYKFFMSSDLVVFPGRHSVLWEQAVGVGVPGVYKKWEGTTHINVNDNVILLEECNERMIYETLIELVNNVNGKYEILKEKAMSVKNEFSYSQIAEKSLL